MTTIKTYPELEVIADKMAREVTININESVRDVDSEMQYKAKYDLEELIKRLEEKV